MGPDAMILVLWTLNFKTAFSLSSFTFIKRLFGSSLLSAIRVVSSAYQVINISPSKLDSSLWFIQPSISHYVFCIWVKQVGWHYTAFMYSFPNFEPLHCNMSSSKCCFLTCTQIYQESGKVVSYSHHFKNCLHFILIHIVKSFSVCSKWSRSRFLLELPCVLYDPRNVGNLISDPSAFSKSSLYIWNFSVRELLKPNLKDFEHYLASVWSEHNFMVVWTFFDFAFLWD